MKTLEWKSRFSCQAFHTVLSPLPNVCLEFSLMNLGSFEVYMPVLIPKLLARPPILTKKAQRAILLFLVRITAGLDSQ